VVLTGYGSISTAVEAIKRGAVNYLTKPVSLERLEKALWVDLPPGEEDPDEPIESLERHEREYLEYVLARCGGNISKAARWLNLHRQSLQRKLRQTGLK
jgi:two-component system response regulator RegA